MKYLITTLLCITCANVVLADGFPGIEKLMTKEEYLASGMHKLDENELAALNQWLIHYTANDASTMRKNVEVVKQNETSIIHSQIDGMFYGWSGKTKFKLKNGQIWQQRYSDKWRTTVLEPEVIIKKNLFGLYDMEIVDEKREIGVKRVK